MPPDAKRKASEDPSSPSAAKRTKREESSEQAIDAPKQEIKRIPFPEKVR